MAIITCAGDGCDQQCIANDADSEGYCPGCASDIPMGSHASAEDHRATERRNLLADGRKSGERL